MAEPPDDSEEQSGAPKLAGHVPTSRFARFARFGALAPRVLPFATAAVRKALSGKGYESDGEAARENVARAARRTADVMLRTLGDMKGLPLKLGQMASYIDGLAPPGYEEKVQSVLKSLQAKAPPLSSVASAKVIQEELGSPPEDIFGTWQSQPFAAASIGQVHRATTKNGDVVAVKVQYPGIDKALSNDLRSLSTLEAMIAPLGRQYHTKETLEEVKSVFMAELDYSEESHYADVFRKIHESDDEIVIPKVFPSLSTRRVLTTELMLGDDYATFCESATQAEKNSAARTIWRFMFRALFGHGLLYADPHPGNYRFLGGGRVAFLDFGCHKVLPPRLVAGQKRYLLALHRGDEDEFVKACVEVLGYDPDDREVFDLFVAYTRMMTAPVVTDSPFRYTRAFARESIAFLVRNGKGLVLKEGKAMPRLPKPIHMPTDFTFVNRLQWGLTSILAGLDAEANWWSLTQPFMGETLPIPLLKARSPT